MRLSSSEARKKRKIRIRKKISGTAERPRLVVFRSNKHIYAQVIDDVSATTLAACSTKNVDGASGSNKEAASQVGREIAARAKGKGVEQVVFDRNGYFFHGRVKALADGAREGGLKF